MSQGGSTKKKIEKVQGEIDVLGNEFRDAGIPSPKQIYRMGEDEFMHHIHTLALSELLKAKLGVTDEELQLEMHKQFLAEASKVLAEAKKLKEQHIRDQISVAPANKIILPHDPQI